MNSRAVLFDKSARTHSGTPKILNNTDPHRFFYSLVSMRYQLYKTSQYIAGWINYFGIANGYQLCCDLDDWIRRRIRMTYWRQWRKPRTKVRNLLRLGVPIKSAVGCGITSKGPWRSSKTPGINQALNDTYLKKEGLVSLRDGWIKLHYSE